MSGRKKTRLTDLSLGGGEFYDGKLKYFNSIDPEAMARVEEA